MTREEVLDRLRSARTGFDARVAAISSAAFVRPVPGGTHTPKQIVWHVAAYDRLMVDRIRAARDGETTALDRDRLGWETFNERTWAEGNSLGPETVRAAAADVFEELLAQVEYLTDQELAGPVGLSASLDAAWLDGRAPWELIAIDGFDHYPMHFGALSAAAQPREG